MNVFITGATGYIGREIGNRLADEGYKVHALIRDLNCKNVPTHKNIKTFKGDLLDYNSILRAMKGCEYVFHTAAYTNLNNPNISPFYNCNVVGTEHILKASYEIGVKKVIYTSSLAVFGPSYKNISITENQPRLSSYLNDYELTKALSEEMVLRYSKKKLACSILNLTRVYGPGNHTFSNGVNRLVSAMLTRDFFLMPNKLEVTTNYVYIDDVINAHLLAIKNGESGKKYIIGGENLTYQELLNKIKTATKSTVRVIKLNYQVFNNIALLCSRISQLMGLNQLVNPKMLKALFTDRMASSHRAISQLGYSITPFDKGLHQTIQFLKQNQS